VPGTPVLAGEQLWLAVSGGVSENILQYIVKLP